MDLQRIFPENSVCLLSETPRERTWRILNISYGALNHLRNWLERELVSVAIKWIEVPDNTSLMPEEVWAHRLGLTPIKADPLVMVDFTEEDPDFCGERTCLIFDLNLVNTGTTPMNVLSGHLQWVPIGNQASLFRDPPRPLYDDIVLAKVSPGRGIQLRAYAVRGTGEQHAKWSAVYAFFRKIPTGSAARAPFTVETGTRIFPIPHTGTCDYCEYFPLEVTMQPGFNCYYLNIKLTGGLTFEDIQRQLDERFDWGGLYPPREIQYFLETR